MPTGRLSYRGDGQRMMPRGFDFANVKSNNENVILDTTNLSDTHKTELLKEISDKGLSDQINVWP